MNAAKIVKPDKDSLIILTAQFCINAILIFLYLLYEPLGFQPESLIYPSCCFLLALTIWSFWSWYILTQSLFNPYLLFFLSALLFNGGQAILEIFHLNEEGILEGEFSSEILLKTLFLVIIGLASFHLGALISAAKAKVISPNYNSEKEAFISTSRDSYRVGWGLLTISFFPALFVIKNALSVALSSGYSSLYRQDYGTSFDAAPTVLAGFLIPAALFILSGSKEMRSGRVISGTIIVIYSATKFFLGQRNQAVMPLIAFAWLWHQLIQPIPKAFLLSSAALIMFIVFPLIAATRNFAGQDRLSIDVLVDTFSSIDNPAIAAISEMGASMMTVAYTIELVPRVKDFQMGVDYFYALLTLMPNLFWKLHPTIARGTASDWLVWEVRPVLAASGGGLGYSFIAEAYLNFGWFGAPIALAVIGFLFAKLVLWALRSGDPARMAMIASFTSFILFYARSNSAGELRSLVWYSLIPYLGVCFLSWLRSKGLVR
jgi:oligosaccharide repeat unit polymerase